MKLVVQKQTENYFKHNKNARKYMSFGGNNISWPIKKKMHVLSPALSERDKLPLKPQTFLSQQRTRLSRINVFFQFPKNIHLNHLPLWLEKLDNCRYVNFINSFSPTGVFESALINSILASKNLLSMALIYYWYLTTGINCKKKSVWIIDILIKKNKSYVSTLQFIQFQIRKKY